MKIVSGSQAWAFLSLYDKLVFLEQFDLQLFLFISLFIEVVGFIFGKQPFPTLISILSPQS